MPVELRKRPAPKEAPAPAAKRSASKPRGAAAKAKGVVEKAKAVVTGESTESPTTIQPSSAAPVSEVVGDSGKIPETVGAGTAGAPAPAPAEGTAKESTSSSAPSTKPEATTPLSESSVGKSLPTASRSTTVKLHDGTDQVLSAMLSSSPNGVVIFTYPKASTPGCTTQACLFRDNYDDITAKGYHVYGLSNDSEKANTGFKTKQNLQYGMLCDPDAKLTGLLGMKKPGNAKGTLRGVVVLAKDGEVKVWFQGGPPKTLDAVVTFLGS